MEVKVGEGLYAAASSSFVWEACETPDHGGRVFGSPSHGFRGQLDSVRQNGNHLDIAR